MRKRGEQVWLYPGYRTEGHVRNHVRNHGLADNQSWACLFSPPVAVGFFDVDVNSFVIILQKVPLRQDGCWGAFPFEWND